MKRILLVGALALLGAFAFSQERIAILPIEDRNNVFNKDELDSFYREFTNNFSNKFKGKFTIVPRQDLDKLIDMEAEFQLSDYSSSDTKTAEMRRVLNATQILSVAIVKVDNYIRITVSRHTIPELEVLTGGTTKTVTNKTQLFEVIPELVETVYNEIFGVKPAAVQKTPVKLPENNIFSNTNFWKRLGYGFLNPLFGTGSYIQGDFNSGFWLTYGYIPAYTLIIIELAAFDYWADGAGICGTIGLGIAIPCLIWGFIGPFVYEKDKKLAQAIDGLRFGIVPTNVGTDLSIMYSIKF